MCCMQIELGISFGTFARFRIACSLGHDGWMNGDFRLNTMNKEDKDVHFEIPYRNERRL